MLLQTILAIPPINQEAVVGFAAGTPPRDSGGAPWQHSLLAGSSFLALRRQLGVRGWGPAPCTASNYSTLILAHLWPMKSRPNSGACVGVRRWKLGPNRLNWFHRAAAFRSEQARTMSSQYPALIWGKLSVTDFMHDSLEAKHGRSAPASLQAPSQPAWRDKAHG